VLADGEPENLGTNMKLLNRADLTRHFEVNFPKSHVPKFPQTAERYFAISVFPERKSPFLGQSLFVDRSNKRTWLPSG
jgi:hypothetical protein